jgi:hypothetical protein
MDVNGLSFTFDSSCCSGSDSGCYLFDVLAETLHIVHSDEKWRNLVRISMMNVELLRV